MAKPMRRRTYVAGLALAVLSGCSGRTDRGGTSTGPPEPTVRWRVDTAHGLAATSASSAILSTGDGYRAVSLEDGSERWQLSLEGSVAALDDRRVYVLDKAADPNGRLLAVQGGTEAWQVEPSAPVDTAFVRDGVVFLLTRGESSYRFGLVALEPTTGRTLWTVPPRTLWSYATGAGLVAYRLAEEPTLVARSTADGTEQWRVQAQADSVRDVSDDVVVLENSDRETVVVRDTEDGTERWGAQTGNRYNEYALLGPRLVRAASSVVSHSTADGSVEWRYRAPGSRLHSDGRSLSLVPDGSDDGLARAVVSLSPETGRERWRYDGSSQIEDYESGPDACYVATEHRLIAVSREDGSARWTYQFVPPERHWPADVATSEGGVVLDVGDEVLALEAPS